MNLIDIEADLGVIDIDLEIGLINIDLALGLPISTGTAGNDHTAGSQGLDVISTFAGDDVIIGSDGIDLIDGGSGTDYLMFDFTSSVRHGNAGSARDVTITNSSVRTGEGGLLGPDVQTAMSNIEGIVLRFGADVGGMIIDTNDDSADASAFTGSEGVQFISGGGTDTFVGSSSDDIFSFLVGAGTNTKATADGGAGNDAALIKIDLSGSNSFTYTDSGIFSTAGEFVSLTNVENVAVVAGNLVAGGRGGSTELDASAASGPLKADFTNGGSVTDFDADITVRGTVMDDVIVTNAGNDTVYGGSGNDQIDGGWGDDALYGDSGDDLLIGGHGDDLITGGTGDDVINGGDGIDTASYRDANGRVVVDLENQGAVQNTRAGGRDTLTGIENLEGGSFNDRLVGDGAANELIGRNGDDALFGGGGSDTLIGGDGRDRLTGGAGADYLAGGDGNDVYYLDDTLDTLSENVGRGEDTVWVSFDYTLGDNFENMQVRYGDTNGTGNALDNKIAASGGSNTLLGLDGNDTLYGRNAADVLDGGSGNDRLFGGYGADTLTGGEGEDRFVYDEALDLGSSLSRADVITDFSSAEGDRINLVDVDANTNAGGNQDFAFLGTGTFTSTAGEMRYYFDGGQTVMEMDTDGDASGDLFLKLDGEIALAAFNFIGASNALPPPMTPMDIDMLPRMEFFA